MTIEKQKAILCVYLLFIKGDTLLMARRKNTPYLNGHYTIPTGHVDTVIESGKPVNESVLEAVIREAIEETGVTIQKSGFTHLLTQIKPSTDVPEPRVCLYFQIHDWTGELTNTEPEKADNFDFYPLNALPQPLLPELASAMTAIAEKRSFDLFNWN